MRLLIALALFALSTSPAIAQEKKEPKMLPGDEMIDAYLKRRLDYNIVKDPVSVHDLDATILHCLGVDHERLTWKFQGRYFQLTDVFGNVEREVLL